MNQWLEGGCHCGAVRYRVRVRERHAIECNCSICSKKGILHHIVTADDFEIISGEDCLTDYRFGTHTARHYFCRICGIQPFYVPRSHPDGWDVNIRTLDEGIDEWEVEHFDGVHWEENVGSIR
ncbi:MAG: GFA family protein [Myxococcota bacterium]